MKLGAPGRIRTANQGIMLTTIVFTTKSFTDFYRQLCALAYILFVVWTMPSPYCFTKYLQDSYQCLPLVTGFKYYSLGG